MRYTFTTPCSHSGEIKPVQKKGGPYEGRWYCRIRGPRVSELNFGVKTVYTNPSVSSARTKIANFLRVPLFAVHILLDGVPQVLMMAGPTSGGSTSPPQAAHAVPDGVQSSFLVPDRATSQHPPHATPDAARSSTPSTTEHVGSLSSFASTAVTPDVARSASTPITPPQGQVAQCNYDRVEQSPNSRATCRTCRGKILTGTLRIGKSVYNPEYGRYTMYYHHKACCSETFLNSLRFEDGRTLQQQLQVQANSKAERRTIIQNRSELWGSLRILRTHLATTEGVEPCKIFLNAAIDAIVLKMPSTPSDLLECNGVGPAILHKYGKAILRIVKEYRNRHVTSSAPQSIGSVR